MEKSLEIAGKTFSVRISDRAVRTLNESKTPLLVEMELYFSCLVRKRVNFLAYDEQPRPDAVAAYENLYVQFRPVMGKQCDFREGPQLTDFPVANPRPFVPNWLDIDFKNGRWRGEFGYTT